MRNLTPEHRAALRISGAANGAMSRGAGRTASKDYVQCCVCCYSVGLGVKKIGKVTNINHAMVRKILIKQGVYKGNTGRKSNPWINGAVAVKRENLFAAYGYESDLRVLRQTDDCKHWARHSVALYHLNADKLRAKAREQWVRIKSDPALVAKKRAATMAWKASEKGVAWMEKNAWRAAGYVCKSTKKRRREDPYFRMSLNLRKRLRDLIKGSGIGKMSELTGCSGAFLRAHIESAFTKGMSWANYGKWHCDHIVPCAAFDLSCPVQRKKCYHYSNLRPLWAKANMDKGASIEPCQPELVLCMAG